MFGIGQPVKNGSVFAQTYSQSALRILGIARVKRITTAYERIEDFVDRRRPLVQRSAHHQILPDSRSDRLAVPLIAPNVRWRLSRHVHIRIERGSLRLCAK